jgi:hypothetical protein
MTNMIKEVGISEVLVSEEVQQTRCESIQSEPNQQGWKRRQSVGTTTRSSVWSHPSQTASSGCPNPNRHPNNHRPPKSSSSPRHPNVEPATCAPSGAISSSRSGAATLSNAPAAGICFFGEAPEPAVGPDRRAGKRSCTRRQRFSTRSRANCVTPADRGAAERQVSSTMPSSLPLASWRMSTPSAAQVTKSGENSTR